MRILKDFEGFEAISRSSQWRHGFLHCCYSEPWFKASSTLGPKMGFKILKNIINHYISRSEYQIKAFLYYLYVHVIQNMCARNNEHKRIYTKR